MIKHSVLTHTEETEFNTPMAVIKLEEGEFKDTLFNFGKVTLPEGLETEPDLDTVPLTFEFNVVKACDGHDLRSLEESADFQQVIGDLLLEIITEQVLLSINE
jgi:hypothetical protein